MKKPTPFGKYLLLDRINVGGMAEVFLAKSFGVAGFERLVAIKKILPTMVEDEEFITMFIDEARIAVQLNHANVVQIYELGKHDENYFIVMEYVSGRDLRTLLDRAKRKGRLLPQGLAAYMAQKVCEGLDYAHRKRDSRGQDLSIIHRDVSPQNTLISFDGEVKLIDFGIAKATNRAQKTQAGILKGKFGYMSPEQVRGLPIDRRSDIFALGVCLYEMLTGEKLFVSESDFSTLEKVRNAEVPPPRQINAAIPENLEKVLMKALARDVEERYQWTSDLQEDLMRYLLQDGKMYGAKHLAEYMQNEFEEEIKAESITLEQYAQIVTPPELDSEPTRGAGSGPNTDDQLGDLPPEMQVDSDEATQLFDPSEHFVQSDTEDDLYQEEDIGSNVVYDDADPRPSDSPVEENHAVEEDALGDVGSFDAEVELEDETQARRGVAASEEDMEYEDTLTPVKGQSPGGPLGAPEAGGHQDAVGLLASEIPSVADGRIPDEFLDGSEAVMDGETRITMTGELATSPSIRSPREALGRERANLVGGAYYAAEGRRLARRVASAVGSFASESPQKRMLLGAAAGITVIVGVLLVFALVLGGRQKAPGDLIIVTLPQRGVEIFIDDILVATESPHVVTGIPPGEYTVAIQA